MGKSHLTLDRKKRKDERKGPEKKEKNELDLTSGLRTQGSLYYIVEMMCEL